MEIEVQVLVGKGRTNKTKSIVIDDEVYLQDQPAEIRELISSKLDNGFVELENATIRVYDSGRMVINVRENV